jgi:orotate phosphoribosyltransferase
MAVDNQIMSENYKDDLLEVLYTKSFKYDKDAGFTLSGGAKSDVYIDVKKTVMNSMGMELVAFAFYQELKNAPIDAIGGLTMGADGIAYSTAFRATLNNKMLDVFIVRKEPKGHGTGAWIEGSLREEAWVAIVEDVTTSGASVIKAIEKAREAGCQIQRVITLIDREEGAFEKVKEATGCKLEHIFTKSDLIDLHEKFTAEIALKAAKGEEEDE